ncbi:MAG: TetR/AcrR family transcriptional regulator [Paracoccaceae bacterium]
MLSHRQISPETHPKQARSKARRQALLDAGVALFNARGMDEISIQEITQAVGFSTGSFYSYFADKTEYFVAVQASVAAQQDALADQIFAPQQVASLGVPDRLRLCVDFAISYFRTHTGLVQAALSYERRIPAGWQPNRQTTAKVVAFATADLPDAVAHKLEIAIQLAFGLLVNALLHDPGPLHLHDPDLADRVMAALTPYLHD